MFTNALDPGTYFGGRGGWGNWRLEEVVLSGSVLLRQRPEC